MANSSESQMGQHKRLAMGAKVGFKKGGGIPNPKIGGGAPPLKTGMPTSPLTDAKRTNGVPGFKKGGKTKGC